MLRVVSHQPAIHELIDRAVARIGYAMKSTDEAAQNNYLRLARGLFLLALESNQLQGVEVDGQQCVIDRGGQITLIPPLRPKQFVQTSQEANIEDIETGGSTDRHSLHQHPLRGSRSSTATAVHSVRYIHGPDVCFNQGCVKHLSIQLPCSRRRKHLSSLLLSTSEDLFERSFVPRRYFLCGKTKNLCISEPRPRASRRQDIFRRLNHTSQHVLQKGIGQSELGMGQSEA